MARVGSVVTAAELAVMDVLWDDGACTVREISKSVYGENSPAYHATVNSLLDQLEKKKFVKRNRSGFAHVFSAKVDRSVLVGRQLQEIADSHFDGALTPMLMALADNLKLKTRDRDAIQKIIDELDQ